MRTLVVVVLALLFVVLAGLEVIESRVSPIAEPLPPSPAESAT